MNTLSRNNQLPSLIENFFGHRLDDLFSSNNLAAFTPAVNVVEHGDGFRIEVAAPGLKKEDFKLNLNHNNLTVSASREETNEAKQEEKYMRREFSYTTFQRTFTLPTSIDADNIQASYTDGVLKVELPKRQEAKVKPARQIEIGG